MQVFIIGTVYETAEALDPRRLWKQILEADQIIKAIEGQSKWSRHPVFEMYRSHIDWLRLYKTTLELYRSGCLDDARKYSDTAELFKPDFIGPYLTDQMKRRLYTKDKEYYKQWADLGESNINFYYVSGSWLQYQNGKRL